MYYNIALGRFKKIIPLQDKSYDLQRILKEAKKYQLQEPAVNFQAEEIKKLCEDAGAKFMVAIIPAGPSAKVPFPLYVCDFKNLFPTQKYFERKDFVPEDCSRTDGHFSKTGHLKYANYLQHIIDSIFAQ